MHNTRCYFLPHNGYNTKVSTDKQTSGQGTTSEAENSDFNLSAVSMGCSSQLQEIQTVIPTATVPETLTSPTHSSARVAEAQLAVQQEWQQKQLLETREPRCTALGTCTSQPFPSQSKPFPEVDLTLQIAATGIIAEGEII